MEQSLSRVFDRCRKIVAASPLFKDEVKITADRITFTSTGATITALASDAASAAGGHPTLAVFDEAWGITHERGRRMFDEMVPVPSRQFSARLIVSHSDVFEGQSELLYEIISGSSASSRKKSRPVCIAGSGELMYWTHQSTSPDQNASWVADMRRKLRPNQFARMIENRFTTAE